MKRLASYSQNFLRNPIIVKELLKRSNVGYDDIVYDIGAGSGVITAEVARIAKQVVAVEFDPRVAETLQRNMAKYDNVRVTVNDALKVTFPRTAYKIVANIPFHLSSPIVQRFCRSTTSPEAAYLIVQRQFGRKLVATDTTHFTSQLGMIVGAEYTVKLIMHLERTDFWPHPNVDTVCIEFLKRPEPLVPKNRLEAFATFTTECFSDPKKLAKLPLDAVGLTPGVSPSRLHLDTWIDLFNSQNVY